MLKTILRSLTLAVICGSPVMAQNALDPTFNNDYRNEEGAYNGAYNSTAAMGDVGNSSNNTMSLEGDSSPTSTQGPGDGGPNLSGTPSMAAGPWGSSGAATGAPFMGTYTAPANMALRAMGRRTLPPTRLESFVQNSGKSEAIYGDEGVFGLPPFFGFHPGHYINTGINMPELTTGHKSDAPSAWGYPQ